jgi:hypothetical protein
MNKKDAKNKEYILKMKSGDPSVGVIAWDKMSSLDLAKIVAYDKWEKCYNLGHKMVKVIGIILVGLYLIATIVKGVVLVTTDTSVNVFEIWVIVVDVGLLLGFWALLDTSLLLKNVAKDKRLSQAFRLVWLFTPFVVLCVVYANMDYIFANNEMWHIAIVLGWLGWLFVYCPMLMWYRSKYTRLV